MYMQPYPDTYSTLSSVCFIAKVNFLIVILSKYVNYIITQQSIKKLDI